MTFLAYEHTCEQGRLGKKVRVSQRSRRSGQLARGRSVASESTGGVRRSWMRKKVVGVVLRASWLEPVSEDVEGVEAELLDKLAG